jgi:hypothetical protein
MIDDVSVEEGLKPRPLVEIGTKEESRNKLKIRRTSIGSQFYLYCIN